MINEPVADPTAKGGQQAVFLSYASEDVAAAERICQSLRAAGFEVWFDRSELRGGDTWDAAIRRQIKQCGLFMPILSANSHARPEGYFRLEWKLAVDRSHLMAADRTFIVPVVIDATTDSDDRVPDRFREIQWIRLPAGETPPSFVERIARLLGTPGTARAVPDDAGVGSAAAADERSRPADTAPTVLAAPAAPSPAPAAPTPSARAAVEPNRNRRVALAMLGLAVIAAGAIGWGTTHFRARTAAPAAYSIEDRRMTFAVQPFKAPPNDAHGEQAAAATTDMFATIIEANTLWVHTAPRRDVEAAVKRLSGAREIAKALDVHFLVRGTLTKAKDGYKVDAVLVDGDSERVLSTKSIAIQGDALTPRWRADVDDAQEDFAFDALQAEVKRAAHKPDDELDVRDLSYRAFVGWADHHGPDAKDAYLKSNELLKRALALAPDDPLATFLMADINLCDCVMAWSHNVEEQKAIGAAALDRYLRMDPTNSDMLIDKALLFQLRGRYEESLVIAESMLERDPEDPYPLWIQAKSLLRLGRAGEAVPIIDGLTARYPHSHHTIKALAAAVHYAVGDYPSAAQLAQNAATQMSEAQLHNAVDGPVRLTLAAAEAHLGHHERAHAALDDFYAAVPNVRTISAIKQWMYTTADLAGFEPLYEGLKLAGVSN